MRQSKPTTISQPKRYCVLDAYRFIAALCVTLYHFERHYQPYLPHPTAYLEKMNHFVDFFFVLSGFVLMHTYGGGIGTLRAFGRFIRKRLARVYPLHAVTTLAFAAAGLIIARLALPVRDPEGLSLGAAPAHLLLVHAWGFNVPPALNFPSWSISAEFFVYLCFPLFAVLVVRLGPARALLLAYGLGLLMTFGHDALGLRSWTDATFDFGNLRAAPSFIAGMAMQRLIAGKNLPRVSFRLAHGGALAVAALMLAQAPGLLIVALFPPAIGLIAAAERSGAPSRLRRGVWLHLGDASYGLYLLHTAVIMVCLVVMRKLQLFAPADMVAVALAGSGAATGLAMLSFRYFENPARRFFGGAPASPGTGAASPNNDRSPVAA